MAKKNARDAATQPSTPQAAKAPEKPVATPADNSVTSYIPKTGNAIVDDFAHNLTNYYLKETPQRTKLLDVFLVFLLIVGAIQFVYCVLAGNFVRLASSTWRFRTRKCTVQKMANITSSLLMLSWPDSQRQLVNSFLPVSMSPPLKHPS